MPLMHADRDAFEAFGALYYPIATTETELAEHAASATDADMAFATTCMANMEGTGYALPPADAVKLARVHGWMERSVGAGKGRELAPDPSADIRLLVPAITAPPMYPGFPREVLEIDEALYRFQQLLHYASTYGIEYVSQVAGSPIAVARGWLPHDGESSPQGIPPADGVQAAAYNVLADAKILKLVLSREHMRDIVLDRLAQPTRMHEAEIRCAVKLLSLPGQNDPIPIAFHENMLGLVQRAALGSRSQLLGMLERTATHPGDVLKAITFLRNQSENGKQRLASRQKKAFCQALERFSYEQLATNIAEANPQDRRSLNYLSIARFGGEKLKAAANAVEKGQVKSWNARLEQLWAQLDETGPDALLAMYCERPGVLLRSVTRLLASGIPEEKVLASAQSVSDAYALPTLARTLTIMSGQGEMRIRAHQHASEIQCGTQARSERRQALYPKAASFFHDLLKQRLSASETPLRGKRVYVDAGDFSLEGSVVMPNEVGNTGTAYPPAGMAYRVPDDATVRFFTFWDDREKRVDVDLHFVVHHVDGSLGHVGWNGDFRKSDMIMSGDITHSENAVEYLDIDMAAARKAGVDFVTQICHIYDGASSWREIDTCFSGACIVEPLAARSNENRFGSSDPQIYQDENVVFRDNMTGEGRRMSYAFIDVAKGYVRLLRGAGYSFDRTAFTLESFIDLLLAAQGAMRVADPEDAEATLSVGRTDNEDAICLIDEGFFLR